jgi:thioredoxin-like negative regulator of GroEL
LDDPRNEAYDPMLDMLNVARTYGQREQELRAELAKSPDDVQINLDLARLLQDEGKFPELNDRLRTAAGLTNWSHEAMAGIIQYYVDQMHNPDAAIAFLEARAKIDPKAGELIYSLAALDSSVGRKDDALKFLTQAVAVGGTNATMSARIDPRFAGLRDDPRFQALIGAPSTTHAPGVNKPATNPPGAVLPKPAKK